MSIVQLHESFTEIYSAEIIYKGKIFKYDTIKEAHAIIERIFNVLISNKGKVVVGQSSVIKHNTVITIWTFR